MSSDSAIALLADESFKWTDFLKQWDVRSSGGIWLYQSHAEVKRHWLKQEVLILILLVHLIPQRQPLQYYSIVSHALLLNYMPIGKSTSIKRAFSRFMSQKNKKKQLLSSGGFSLPKARQMGNRFSESFSPDLIFYKNMMGILVKSWSNQALSLIIKTGRVYEKPVMRFHQPWRPFNNWSNNIVLYKKYWMLLAGVFLMNWYVRCSLLCWRHPSFRQSESQQYNKQHKRCTN